ncbi:MULTISPECIES: carbohydrate ABC transporter permease [Arthrobacter]|uniref:Carbohydrate ABC transporter permease n=2 Tax=Arthrobacter TaxID=1663 RepID=A0ABU9KK95_9MICC|nr:carbohydrate ABC transporter permease [Arthrobacter sp. YJM1]MDP5227318.1 carbohydrate ABC transporter permease [Arthrobacter sp. YJM1]
MTTLTSPTQPAQRTAPAPAGRRRPLQRVTWSSRLVVNLVLVLFSLYTLLPLSWLVIAATKDSQNLFGSPGFTFGQLNLLENLTELFTWEHGTYLHWLGNTALYAGLGSVTSVAVSFLAGHAFDKFDFPGKERWFSFVLLGVLLPGAVTTMPLYLMASSIGLVNTFWGVFLPGLASPFGVYLARMFCKSYVPKELVEAARIDGAGELRIFFAVAAPLMKPGIVTLLLMTFSAIWNNFFLPLVMLSDSSLFPVALGIYSWNSRVSADPEFAHLVVTGSLVAIIPVIGLFLGLQRFWKGGLGAGALK